VQVEPKNSEGRENEEFKTKLEAWIQSSVSKEVYTSDL
jgi:hypothetical protein